MVVGARVHSLGNRIMVISSTLRAARPSIAREVTKSKSFALRSKIYLCLSLGSVCSSVTRGVCAFIIYQEPARARARLARQAHGDHHATTRQISGTLKGLRLPRSEADGASTRMDNPLTHHKDCDTRRQVMKPTNRRWVNLRLLCCYGQGHKAGIRTQRDSFC